jgi:hypothetical protein
MAFREISNLACIGAHEATMLLQAIKISNTLYGAIVFADGIVILDTDPQTQGKFSHVTHKHHLSSPSAQIDLAPVTHLDHLDAIGLSTQHALLPHLSSTHWRSTAVRSATRSEKSLACDRVVLCRLNPSLGWNHKMW